MQNNGYYKAAYTNTLSLAWYKLLTCKIHDQPVSARGLEVLFSSAERAMTDRLEVFHSILEDTSYISRAVKQVYNDVREVAELNDYSVDAMIEGIKSSVFEHASIESLSVKINEKKSTQKYKMNLAYGNGVKHYGYAVFNSNTGKLDDYDLEYELSPWTSIPGAIHSMARNILTIVLLNTTMENALDLNTEPA